jgi:hypothetical protein
VRRVDQSPPVPPPPKYTPTPTHPRPAVRLWDFVEGTCLHVFSVDNPILHMVAGPASHGASVVYAALASPPDGKEKGSTGAEERSKPKSRFRVSKFVVAPPAADSGAGTLRPVLAWAGLGCRPAGRDGVTATRCVLLSLWECCRCVLLSLLLLVVHCSCSEVVV